MMKFLEGEEITAEELHAGIRAATLSFDIVPVLCGSAFKNKGVQPLLDAVVRYLPAPVDVPDVEGVDPAAFARSVEQKTELTDENRQPFATHPATILCVDRSYERTLDRDKRVSRRPGGNQHSDLRKRPDRGVC